MGGVFIHERIFVKWKERQFETKFTFSLNYSKELVGFRTCWGQLQKNVVVKKITF